MSETEGDLAQRSPARARLKDARSLLDRERERTLAERDALTSFRERVEALDPEGGGASAATVGPRTVQFADRTSGATQVLTAYRETIMDVPHYEAEYGESLAEHLQADFGSRLAVALIQAEQFSPQVKQNLLAETRRLRRQRTQFLKAIDREAEDLSTRRCELESVARDCDALGSEHLDRRSFGTVAAQWRRVAELEDACERVITRRQSALARRGSNTDTVLRYVYRPLDVAHPVVDAALKLLDRLRRLRRERLHELLNRE